MSSDAVSLFAEGTFEEQVQELVNYLARGLGDEARTAFIRPFQDALITREGQKPNSEDAVRRKKTIGLVLAEVKDLGEGNEREIEGFFNLLFSHLLVLFPATAEIKEHVTYLLNVISSANSEGQSSKYRVLSNLFNALPRKSPLRLDVYNALLALAVANDELDVLQLGKSNVEGWLSEWEISDDEKHTFLKSIADAFDQAGQPETSYEYLVSRLQSLPTSSSVAESAALDTIVAALRQPMIFDLNQLLKIDAIQAIKGQPLFALLRIFLHGDLNEYKEWAAQNSETISKFGLDGAALDRKIRFLTLASLATKYIGRDLPYAEIASVLQVEEKSVEVWVIDAIRAKLLSGKLSQPTETLHVTRSTSRAFDKSEWTSLEQRLVSWRAGLVSVLDVVSAARKTSPAYTPGKNVQKGTVPVVA